MTRRTLPLVALSALALAACGEVDTTTPLAPEARAPIAQTSLQQSTDVVPGRVLARFTPGAPAEAIAAGQGASIERTMSLGIRVLSVPVGAEARVAAAMARNPNVEFAEPDIVYTFGNPSVMPVNDPYIGYKWDLDNDGSIYSSTGNVLANTGAPDADMDWREAVEAVGTSNGAARVGIMDTGIRNDHEEFQGRIATQFDFFDNDGNAEDDDGHGSHVAGIIAASTDNGRGVAGVAYTGDVTFAIAKVCGPIFPFGYGCPSSAIADGITWAVDNGADVLNLSLGGGSGSSAQRSALQYARSQNVLPFCAAGNESGPVSYPAAFPECVAVSATDWGDNLASYSNSGPEVELAAPGGDGENSSGYSYILSAYNGSSTSYAFIAGTSMASPNAAGAAALLHVLGETDDDAKLTLLKSTADDLGAAGADNLFGAGRVNVYNAVSALSGGGTPNNPPTANFTYTCTDLTCDFTDTSSDSDGSVVAWSWIFGGDGTSSQQNPTHTFSAAGNYVVTLVVTDDDGATDDQIHGVAVTAPAGNDPPQASFTFTCTDLTCDFTDTSDDSDGSVVSWSWDFGGDGSSSQQNPSHTFSGGGTYQVTLTATDDDGASDQASQSVTVSEPASITLSATGTKERGFKTTSLTWSGASSASVDIYRDGVVVATTANDGAHVDPVGKGGGGSHVYRVCEAGTANCSNTVNVSY